MTHVFISYSRKDTDFVNKLERALQARGIVLWRDVHSIPGGAKWFRRIKQGLEASYAMLYIDTAHAEMSDWVEREFLFGASLNLPIIPIKQDMRYMSLQTINLNPILCDDASFDVGIGKIMARLSELPKKPIVDGAQPPPEPERHETLDPLEVPDDTETIASMDYAKELQEYIKWALVEWEADLSSVLYVNLQAYAEVSKKSQSAKSKWQLDTSMSFAPLELERIHGEAFDRAGEPVPDARVPVTEHERVILLGEPGSGKTTTLLQLAVDLARAVQNDGDALVPVFVPLRKYDGTTSFEAFVRAQMYNLQNAYADLVAQGKLIFLLDALNEMPRTAEDGADLVARVREFAQEQARWVVSCRVRDYQEELKDIPEVNKVRLQPLDPPRIYDVIARRFREQFAPEGIATEADGEQLWRDMYGTDDLLIAWQVHVNCDKPQAFWGTQWDRDVKGEGKEYRHQITGYYDWGKMSRDRRRMMFLCRNPYMLKMVSDLYANDKSLPDNRGALFKKFVDKLLERDRQLARAVGAEWVDDALIRKGLAEIAYRMGAQTEMPRTQAEAILREVVPTANMALLLRIAQGASLLDVGQDVRFTHQLLQEYFASEVLGALVDAGTDPTTLWQPANWWESNGREETIIILAGVRGDPEGIARWLAPAQPELAVQVLTDSGIPINLDELELSTRQALIESALAKIAPEAEPNPIGRASAYRVLGLLNGDTRPGVGTFIRDGVKLPDIEWVTIPAGEFSYQNGRQTLDYDYQIARYPVTYAQFQTFLDDPEGYGRKERWFEGLHEDSLKRDLSEQRFKYWNHPRERVSWYDAIAFCRWFSWRLGGDYALDAVEQWAVRLPTEFEWEKAARAMTGWIYPYGAKFDAMKGNTLETGIQQTSAVGIFPSGDTPHWEKPISDLSGNVWEWCLTDYNNPQFNAMDENMRSDSRRVLRAGSWRDSYGHARAVSRYFNDPYFRYFNIGFRLFCRPPSR